MTLDMTKEKIDTEAAAKKLTKEAKKLEKQEKKAKKAEAKRAKFLASPKGKIIAELEAKEAAIDALQAQYEQEVAKRGINLKDWPIEVLAKFKGIAPYEAFGIVLPEDQPSHVDYEFDPTKGFRPTVQAEPELIQPFTFINNLNKSEKPKQPADISDAEFMALEMAFGEHLTNYKYRYETYNGIYKLFISRINNVEEEYVIDNGTVLGGNKFSILANKVNDTVFVSLDDPEVPQILKSKFYVVSDECATRNESNLFNNGIIYRYIDFSNTSWLNSKDVDLKKLEANLSIVIQIASNIYSESPRMRFNRFESANSFELISDSMTKSPLSDINATCGLILNLFRIKVNDNKVTVYNSETLIDQYTISAQ